MEYTLTDYLVSLFITILIYDTIPIILVLLKAKLKIWKIRIISILNFIIGISIFTYYTYLATGTFSHAAGGSLLWTLVGYWLMCKYCKVESKNKIGDSDQNKEVVNISNNVVKFHSIKKEDNESSSEIVEPSAEKSKRNLPFIICIIIIILLAVYSGYSTYKSYIYKESLSTMADKYKKLNDKNSDLQSQLDDLTTDYNNLKTAYEVVYQFYIENSTPFEAQ